ncbi:MAG TPA: pyridoxal phosphate-dependent aminotransferase [Planctomycetes bacterium]|nr:pyridoxal phosphate-dependent aminotransferase [Planctomycetota bacterium]
MSMPISKRLQGLAQSDIRAMTRRCMEVGGINLGQGICDLPTPPLVRDAAIQAIVDRKSIYSPCEGILRLREAISLKLERDNGISADPRSEIVVTTGSAAAFACTLHALLDPGDGIMIPQPHYGYHVNAARVAGVEVHSLVLKEPEYLLDADLLRANLRSNTRAILLCTPGNPSGHMLRREEIECVAEVARERDLLVITDEIYEYIRYEGREHLSPSVVADLAPRTVTIMGLSKTFSITGWRLGYAVAPPVMAEAIALVHDVFYICAPTPLQYGVTAGFASPPEFFESMRADYTSKRERLFGALSTAGLEPIQPEGAYYMLARSASLECSDSKEAAFSLLDRCGVASVPGAAFYSGPQGEDWLRFCFAKEDAELDKACTRLEKLGA